jgi:membrane-associated PAP2 superfamily phosphatase
MNNTNLLHILIFITVDVALFLTASLLFQLDWLVNNLLYDYGLQFNPNWATIYWTAIRASLGLIAFSIIAVSLTSYASYKKAKEETRKTVLICKSCGAALAKVEGNVNLKESIPKFEIMKTCPFCDEKLLETQSRTH